MACGLTIVKADPRTVCLFAQSLVQIGATMCLASPDVMFVTSTVGQISHPPSLGNINNIMIYFILSLSANASHSLIEERYGGFSLASPLLSMGN